MPDKDKAAPQGTNRKMLEFLVCPLTHDMLRYNRDAQELVCLSAKLAFPIRDGVPIMLVDEARKISLEELNADTLKHPGAGPDYYTKGL